VWVFSDAGMTPTYTVHKEKDSGSSNHSEVLVAVVVKLSPPATKTSKGTPVYIVFLLTTTTSVLNLHIRSCGK